MRYHGFDIEPVYLPGSDFHICNNGRMVYRRPKRENIDYYTLTQVDDGWTHANCLTIDQAKLQIDHLHQVLAEHGCKLV